MSTFASSFTLPGGLNTFIPQLQSDLVVEVSRNPEAFPINKYIDYRIVDKERGDYVVMQNNTQGLVLNTTDDVWADGGERPGVTNGPPPFKFSQYSTKRRSKTTRLGYLSQRQAAWDILGQSTRFLAQAMMTARALRIHTTLTTSANWGANYSTSTALAGGTWANATSLLPYIRLGLTAAQIVIDKATYNSVGPDELFLVMNPDTARVMATSAEWIDFIKQSPDSARSWQADKQFRLYGLPAYAMGLEIVVDGTSYNSGPPGDIVTNSYTFPDNYVVLLSKKKAISGGQSAFSTYSPFIYEDMTIESWDDPKDRLTEIAVTEDIDDSSAALVASFAGYLINIAS